MPRTSQTKLIKQLRDKKYRAEHGLFLVEGEKNLFELLTSDFVIEHIFLTYEFSDKHADHFGHHRAIITIEDQEEIERLSTLESNNAGFAVVRQKENKPFTSIPGELVLALDTIQDPGNLGTILRIADWYGITHIVASQDTVDFYNPKVIAASRGSFARVEIFYTQLKEYISHSSLPILGTFLEGESVHSLAFPTEGILLMGNESHGIQSSLASYVTKKITIPAFGKAESLNVSVATAVILDNWKRYLVKNNKNT